MVRRPMRRRPRRYFDKACRGGVAASCFALGNIYRNIKDEATARQRFQQACDASVRHEIANAAYFRASDNAPTGNTAPFCPPVAP